MNMATADHSLYAVSMHVT